MGSIELTASDRGSHWFPNEGSICFLDTDEWAMVGSPAGRRQSGLDCGGERVVAGGEAAEPPCARDGQ